MKKIPYFLILSLLTIGIFFPSFVYKSFADNSQSSSSSCSSSQSGKNNNNNCNQQNQNQTQDQTQNNNQNVNITLNQPTPQILAVVPAKRLPSTGTPLAVWALFGGLWPLGILLRRITKKK